MRPPRSAARGDSDASTISSGSGATGALVLLALTGCGAIIGLDDDLVFDRPGPSTSGSGAAGGTPGTGGAAGFAGAAGVAGAGADVGGCGSGEKSCDGRCEALDDPLFGCGPDTCDACLLGHAAEACDASECAVGACENGWVDQNGLAGDGCEAPGIPLDGLILWLKADDSGQDLGQIDEWEDRSPAGTQDAIQLELAKQPVLEADAIGGLPAVRFDGMDDVLELPRTGFADFSDGFTLFLVFFATTNTDNERYLELSNGPANVISVRRYMNDWSIRYLAGDVDLHTPQGSFKINEPVAVTVTHAPSGDAMVLVNGTSAAVPASGLLPSVIERTTNFIGRGASGASVSSFKGSMGEIALYSRALSRSEIDAINAYAVAKWGCCP